ncbi:hypothetical protein TELCIR_05244 [Teladorsagia circumcincta]|uniref:Hexosyltransferase n=1 Tax=Teladorsagia circumcincta TaxID=45464 RepID=A0A2G9URC8_TELCI|nr:hypothetical protein TELCIR_05244 [Teladorsagia circumcincta]
MPMTINKALVAPMTGFEETGNLSTSWLGAYLRTDGYLLLRNSFCGKVMDLDEDTTLNRILFRNTTMLYRYLLLPNISKCNIVKNEIAAVVLTTPERATIRQAIRKSWASPILSRAIMDGFATVFFFVGAPKSEWEMSRLLEEQESYHDLIITDIEESYENLVFKDVFYTGILASAVGIPRIDWRYKIHNVDESRLHFYACKMQPRLAMASLMVDTVRRDVDGRACDGPPPVDSIDGEQTRLQSQLHFCNSDCANGNCNCTIAESEIHLTGVVIQLVA